MKKSFFGHWRGNFLSGLAVLLPAVISIGLFIWLFGTVANLTDLLLFFLPRELTHKAGPDGPGTGPMFWYWSLAALALTVLLVSVVGLLARNFFGRKLIEWVDTLMMRVPILNKVYAATKQINDAFASGNKNAFKTVVIIEFPRAGIYSLGFITSEQHAEVQARTKEKVVCVFVPTTPNPTSGWLVLVPEKDVTKLDMTVADGIKYIISLGSVAPIYSTPTGPRINGGVP